MNKTTGITMRNFSRWLTCLTALSLAQAGQVAHAETAEKLPIMTVKPALVCKGVAYLNLQGERTVGTRVCQAKACTKAGELGCLTTEELPAVDKANIQPAAMVKGYSLAGVTGTFDPNQPEPVPCTKDGQSECIATKDYVAVARAKLKPANIAKGVTIPGIAKGDYPSAKNPLAGYDPAAVVLTGQGLANALQKKGSVQFWNKRGERQVVSIDVGLEPRNIAVGKSIHGIKGVMKRDTFPDCSTTKLYNCKVKQGFVAVKTSKLLQEHFRKGIKIGPITGSYPSASSPLTTATKDTLGLTESNFSDSLSQNTTFEFFRPDGTRQTYQGDVHLQPMHIKRGLTVLGKTGQFQGLDGGDQFDEFDILKGHTVAGIEGKLDPYCGTKGTCRQDYWQDRSVRDDGSRTTCQDSSTCLFYHNITKVTWLMPKMNGATSWTLATQTCQNLRHGGHSDWRLPTQKEAMQAMVHGMGKLGYSSRYQNTNNASLWTSTSNGSNKFHFSPSNKTMSESANASAYTACIR